jgi:hypothetical protein
VSHTRASDFKVNALHLFKAIAIQKAQTYRLQARTSSPSRELGPTASASSPPAMAPERPLPPSGYSQHRSHSVASSSVSSPSPSGYGQSSRSKSSTRFLLPRGRRASSSSSKSPGSPQTGPRAEEFGLGISTDNDEQRGRLRGRVGGREKGAKSSRAASVQAFGDAAQQKRYDWVMGKLHPIVKHFLGWREKEGVTTGGGKAFLPVLNRVSPGVSPPSSCNPSVKR